MCKIFCKWMILYSWMCMECWKFGIKFSLIHDMDKIRRF